jgi:hypothetical protein
VLFLHETHRVAGARADDFEDAWRKSYIDALASTEDARLLWFMHHAHGTGPSYVVATVTALADAAAWERLSKRLEDGDLRSWSREIGVMRNEVTSKLLAPVSWSQLQEIDLASVPVDGSEREARLYMEDTVLPFVGKLDAYLEAAGTLYAQETVAKRLADGTGLLDLRAAFRTVLGPHADREVILWQRIERPEVMQTLLTREVPPEYRAPGTWMHDALAYRDRWESRLLRTAAWSPLD